MYADPVVPDSKTSIDKLQEIQNSAIRFTTGCLFISSFVHLHMGRTGDRQGTSWHDLYAVIESLSRY